MSHVRQYQTIGAAPAEVFERFASLEGIRSWWTEDASGGSGPGQRFSLGFGRPERLQLEVLRYDPGRRVEWGAVPGTTGVWRGTRLLCAFEPCSDPLPWQTVGTAVRLEHTGFVEFGDEAARCNTTWSRLLLGFKRMCEVGAPSSERWRP